MDDVHELLKSAKEESYLFVVDSRTRDTAVWPTPSEYEISFASPFRNVFGLDLLDATVARTEFIVDATTNTLDYVTNQPTGMAGEEGKAWNNGSWVTSATDATGAPTPRRTVTLDPGDYNLPQFIEHLNDKLGEAARLHAEAPIKCSAMTNPAEISNRVVFTCTAPFTFLMATSTLRYTLGFGTPVVTTQSADYATVPGWSMNRTGGASHAFLSLPAGEIPDLDPQVATLGPLPTGTLVDYEPLFGAKIVAQHFVSQATGPATSLALYAYSGVSAGVIARLVRTSDGALMATGRLAVPAADQSDVYMPVVGALEPQAGRLLAAGTAYSIQLEREAGGGSVTDFVALYYGKDNLAVEGGRYITVDGVAAWPGQNLCADVTCASYGHAIRCPGIVNLTGPRYVSIRCPDIESHLFRDRVNEACHAGMGMVQLRGYGFREQRFDFVSFPPRRFHPIGRLTKLRFRLERPDGTLYASQGVDHTLLLVLRYYSLPQAAATERSDTSLNPAYAPDLTRMLHHRWHATAAAQDRDRILKRY
jgi:hypothetical protein